MSRFHFKPLVALVVAGAAALAVAATGGVLALWRSDTSAPASSFAQGQIYAEVTRTGGTADVKSVATAGQKAQFALSGADAIAVSAAESGIAVPFTVKVMGDGNTGVDYSLVLPAADADSVAESSVFRIFRPTGACSASNVPGDAFTAAPGQTVGPFPGAAPGADLEEPKSDAWCLVVQLDVDKLGKYEITSTAEGTGAGTKIQASDSWKAVITPPDPGANLPYKITLETLFTRPDTSPRPAPGVTDGPPTG
jgi:hypothetical protein